jgi:hypothetical protein
MRLLRPSSSRSTWQAWVPCVAFPYDAVNPPSAERRVHTDHTRMVWIPCVYDCELLGSMTGWMLSHILGTYAVSRLQSKNKTIKVTNIKVRGVNRAARGNKSNNRGSHSGIRTVSTVITKALCPLLNHIYEIHVIIAYYHKGNFTMFPFTFWSFKSFIFPHQCHVFFRSHLLMRLYEQYTFRNAHLHIFLHCLKIRHPMGYSV